MRNALDNRGQGSVEAAIAIPVMFLLLLLLIQPGIVLYDRLVMGNAAAEACRLLATATDLLVWVDGAQLRGICAASPGSRAEP